MAHFAKLDDKNLVIDVNVVSNETLDANNEEISGIDFLTEWSGGYSKWKQTSINNKIRKNYAGIGFYYDEQRDAFIPPKTFDSWILNEGTCNWDAPFPKPEDDKRYIWNESKQSWDEIISK